MGHSIESLTYLSKRKLNIMSASEDCLDQESAHSENWVAQVTSSILLSVQKKIIIYLKSRADSLF